MKSSIVSRILLTTALVATSMTAVPAWAKKKPPPPPPPVAAPLPSTPVDRFYSARKDAPLWMANREGQLALINLMRESTLDGFARGPQLAAQIEAQVSAAQLGNAAAAKTAERMMSQALIDYVQSLYLPVQGMTYGDNWVRPHVPTGETVLAMAARAPVLADYVNNVWNINPIYAQLRQTAVAEAKLPDGGQSQRLAYNLQRARFKSPSSKFVVVDSASQKLWMYENGQVVDSMKVVVGKNEQKGGVDLRTPMIASVMYYTIYNPYWHMPDHLTPNLAKAALSMGAVKALSYNKYEVVDGWTANPTILDPTTVDWKGVINGTVHVKLRQKPTGANSMGKMKFPFENGLGIYLHDTPHKEYFAKSDRTLSNGCVRLERAADFGSWLMGKPARPEDTSAELTVAFPQGVPVYVTYLTAYPDAGKIVYAKDVYGWDKNPPQAVAASGAVTAAPTSTFAAPTSGTR